MKPLRSLSRCIAAAVVLSFPIAARATLLVYEDFNYTAGSNALPGKNGGIGYSAAYPTGTSNNADVLAGSFNYTDADGKQLVTSGNRAFMDSTTVGNPDGTAVSIAPNRNLNTANFSSLTDGPLFVSFMGQQTAGDLRDVTVALFVSTPNDPNGINTQERLSIGHGNPSAAGANDGNANWGAYADAVGQNGAYSNVPATTLSLIVVRIDLNIGGGTLDSFKVYVNPTLGAEPAVADASSSAYNFLTSLSEINRVRMRAGGSSNSTSGLNLGASQLAVDEIRIGTTYADVTPFTVPEPTSSLLFGIGATYFALGRRRTQRAGG